MKEAGNSKLSVLVDTERTKCAIKVFFRHGTEILCTINVLFTFTEIFKEMKRKSRAVYLSEMHPAGYSNALHVVREVFLLVRTHSLLLSTLSSISYRLLGRSGILSGFTLRDDYDDGYLET